MLAKLASYTLVGIDATPVEVEVDVSFSSNPKTILVGLAEACGLVAGLVLVKKKKPIETFDPDLGVGMVCRGHMFRNGMIMRAVGDRMIIAPPLVITRAQIDEMIGLIRHCLDETYKDVKARGWL